MLSVFCFLQRDQNNHSISRQAVRLDIKMREAITLLIRGAAPGEIIKRMKCVTPAIRPPVKTRVIPITTGSRVNFLKLGLMVR